MKSLNNFFVELLKCDEDKAFVVDMENGYPKIIKECFVNKVNIQ